MSRRRLAWVIAASLLTGCAAETADSGHGQATAAQSTDTLSGDAQGVETTDAGAPSRVVRCLPSSNGRCTYVTTTTSWVSPLAVDVPIATFKGMWDDDPADGGQMARACGYLIIEEPYVHLLQTAPEWERGIDPGLLRGPRGELQYLMLQLPRPGTRYDAQTRSLFVYHQGPMTDGDHVMVGGGQGHRPLDAEIANVHERRFWRANSMGPTERPC